MNVYRVHVRYKVYGDQDFFQKKLRISEEKYMSNLKHA